MAPGNRKSPTRAKSSESQYSLMEFMARFPDDDACLAFLWRTRYSEDGEHALCPSCEVERTFRKYEGKQQRQAWTCVACGHYLYPTAGTIFHKSSTALHLWFYAMYLMASTRCGISAKQLERELGVTYKTAWRMFTKIRNQLMGGEAPPLSGVVEMDETYMGGKPRAADKAQWAKSSSRRQTAKQWSDRTKTPIFGMVERNRIQSLDGEPVTVTKHGNVAAYVVPSVQAATVGEHINYHVEKGTRIVTDEGPAYRGLAREGWKHLTINHAEGQYVMDQTHTNTIEGFWSLVKRGITGTHHAVSRKWLQGYVDEYVWRYNRRGDARSMFEALILLSAFPVAE